MHMQNQDRRGCGDARWIFSSFTLLNNTRETIRSNSGIPEFSVSSSMAEDIKGLVSAFGGSKFRVTMEEGQSKSGARREELLIETIRKRLVFQADSGYLWVHGGRPS